MQSIVLPRYKAKNPDTETIQPCGLQTNLEEKVRGGPTGHKGSYLVSNPSSLLVGKCGDAPIPQFLIVAQHVKSNWVAFQCFKTFTLVSSHICLQDEITRTSSNNFRWTV